MQDLKANIKEKFPDVIFSEPLRNHCTFKIGGPADFLYKAKTSEKLIEIIKFAQQNAIPFLIIGGGSNILFDDKGYRGLIIRIISDNISIKDDEITADAGVTIADLIETAIKSDLSGLAKWIGLPGTVGGAVRGNSGCNGLETKDILIKATLLNPATGETQEVNQKYFEYGYRESKLKESQEIILNATFKLNEDHLSQEQQEQIMQDIRNFRGTAQPPGFSSGSFFKNPSPDKPAGMLIDQAGLKGTKIGNAQISELHGNFFLNLGGKAKASEMVELAKLAKKEVKKQFNIDLKQEVQILSDKGKIAL